MRKWIASSLTLGATENVSEQNILNPTTQSVMNPHYSIPHKDPATDVSWQARSGEEYDRDMLVRGMEWQLHWDKVPFSTYQALRQWFRQYRKGFFSYFDIDDNRYYSGKFLAEPQFERVANNQVNVSATFVEIPKVALFQYPSNWGVDSNFVEERGDYGQDLVKLTGATWALSVQTWHHGGQAYQSATTNDIAEWGYFGYGFRYWAAKAGGFGIVEISLDGTVLGTVDLFNGATLNAAALFTQLSVPLGSHRVKIRCTGTKNAGSSGFLVAADAIEVMR
jgi:hypothetical protein